MGLKIMKLNQNGWDTESKFIMHTIIFSLIVNLKVHSYKHNLVNASHRHVKCINRFAYLCFLTKKMDT